MGFIQGFLLGIAFTIFALVVFAKPIMKLAAKRGMNHLMTNVQGQVNNLVKSIPIETDPDKLFEDDKNVKTKE